MAHGRLGVREVTTAKELRTRPAFHLDHRWRATRTDRERHLRALASGKGSGDLDLSQLVFGVVGHDDVD
jgi:hypothetical protein